jgi:alcohol dehydrogenase class IV
MDAAKAMMIFYEAPDLSFEDILRTDKVPARRRKSQLICISSTSGTGSEVTRAAVVTDTATHIKEPIIRPICRADVAILDADLTMTMPPHVIAETGMDALTHAVEAYTNHALDDFNEVWAKGAIEGIMKWLPVSYTDNTIEAHEKIHNYQAMAGFAFTNVGLGAVHGIAHSIGGAYNTGHGLANGVILPYILDYNRKDAAVAQKLAYLSRLLGFGDIVAEIKTLKAAVGIPLALKGAGIAEDDYKKDLPVLIEHAMLGATQVNPRPVTKADMERLLHAAYYGVDVDF